MESGYPVPLQRDVDRLQAMLDEILEEQVGPDAVALSRELFDLAAQRRAGDDAAASALAERIEALDIETLRWLVRACTFRFDLVNLAEDRHRVRVLRERERASHPEPRSESVVAAFEALVERGADIDAVIARLSIEPVFTAHPTEAKRRTGRAKLRRIRECLDALDNDDLLPRERERERVVIQAELTGLWQTDLLRPHRPTVLEEVRQGLHFMTTLWEVVPGLCRDVGSGLAALDGPRDSDGLRASDGEAALDLPVFLRFGSWIGGDRDGNPNVTAAVIAETLRRHRETALRTHLDECRRLLLEMSPSVQQKPVSDALAAALEAALERWPAARENAEQQSPYEVYRRWLRVVEWRLQQTIDAESLHDEPDGAYHRAGELLADIRLVAASLSAHEGGRLVDAELADWLWRIRVFGFHIARLDLRDNSRRHEQVLDEVLAAMEVVYDYRRLPEERRIEVLTGSMPAEAALLLSDLSPETRDTLALFRLAARVAQVYGPEALGAYVISMTAGLSDVLEVLWLAEWAGVGRDGDWALPIVPLFETIDDLRGAAGILEAMFAHPAYAELLERQGCEQIVMIGYSDSTKDGGYLAANWALYAAQRELQATADRYGVRLTFFHGRGGSLGRGGGPAARGILAQPPDTAAAGLRVTEQGEVLAERYDNPAIAHRHLEQLIWAKLLAGQDGAGSVDEGAGSAVVEALAERALAAYLELIEDDGFLPYFGQATPIRVIETLPIASRPSRRSGQRTLQDLRAIPWVFAWTQSRQLVPAWYGLGTALQAYADEHGWGPLRELYQGWPYFRAMVANAEMALSKADMGIARAYARLVEDSAAGERIRRRIAEEHDRSRTAILEITGQTALLSGIPWLRRSVQVRNPYVDVLNLVQVEAFRRLRSADEPTAQRLDNLLRLTVQGIASGLRTTG